MFVFEEPLDLNNDWCLGDKNKFQEKIQKHLLKNISNTHIISVQFLFENFIKKRKGAILNQDKELNMPLQVCTFLSILKDKIDASSPVLIITSEYSFCKWHYHASEAGFKPKIITPNDSEYVDHIYLLDSEALKLAEKLLCLNLFCVVIDNLDSLATKLPVKKLRGNFNIGLTEKNFYKYPDPKLKWAMLNWASPGCVGKLADFYRIDRKHFLAFADNYRYWWMRITWKFCDSFEPPTEEYLEEYQQKLQEWGKLHNIRIGSYLKHGSKRSNFSKRGRENKKLKSEYSPSCFHLPDENDLDPSSPQNISNYGQEPEHIDVKVDFVKDLSVGQEYEPNNTDMSSKEETQITIRKDAEFDKEEPILSIIYSKTSHEIEDRTTVNVNNIDSNFFSSLLSNETSECEISQSKSISDNPSESNLEEDTDDNSFFSEFILGNK